MRQYRFLTALLFALVAAVFSDSVLAEEGTLIVLNKSEATASLFDLASGRIAATVPTGAGPHEVAVSPNGKRALVANYGGREPGSTLTLIDVAEANVIRTIDLGRHQRPHGIQYLQDGRRAVVTAEASRALLIVNADSGEVTRAIPTDQEISHMVALAPDGTRAFVANIGSGSMTAVDLEQGTRLKNLETGDGAEGVDVTPDGRQVWVTNRAADTITVIDARSLETIDTLEASSFPIRIKITPDGRRALVSCARSGDVAVFDTESRAKLLRIAMKLEATSDTEGRLFSGSFGKSSVPIGILVHPSGRTAYVAHTQADQVSVIDLSEMVVVQRLESGREPDGLGYSPLKVAGS
ncbi:MAG: beta-propeller fold lactonase family protein [Acidobacteriota bacterium]|nr:MAG: beta-propeller fold lactonase family protein [Acidobacteriota bacterium]